MNLKKFVGKIDLPRRLQAVRADQGAEQRPEAGEAAARSTVASSAARERRASQAARRDGGEVLA